MRFEKDIFQKGFTLIELLVVIAILGILAGAVLVGVNPIEQLARARDTSKLSTIGGLGRSVQSYYTSQSGVYPTANATWMTTLQTAGELKSLPSAPSSAPCPAAGPNVQNGYCYNTNATPDAVVFALAESTNSFTKAGCSTGQSVWIVWSSAAGKSGLTCTTNATTYPAVGIATLQ